MIKEKLEDAIERRNNDLSSFVWKEKKEEIEGKIVQKEVKLVDCTEQQLQKYYDHCESML